MSTAVHYHHPIKEEDKLMDPIMTLIVLFIIASIVMTLDFALEAINNKKRKK